MSFGDPPRYPSKLNNDPDGDFTIPQFFLPTRIFGEEVWALLDTGANISIVPKTVADQLLPAYAAPIGSGEYMLADLVGVPYSTYSVDVQLLKHINGTIQEMDLRPYSENGEPITTLNQVEVQVPHYTWPEIADRLHADGDISAEGEELNYVIFGLDGILDRLSVTTVGDNLIQVEPVEPR